MDFETRLMLFFRRKKKIGLVLGSGAARGLAHIGVIKALQEKNVPIDLIAGSSIGALVGACYAKAGSIAEFEQVVLRTDWRRLLQLADFNLALMFKGFVQGQKVKELLRTIIGDVHFKDLKIPLAIVATDLHTGESIVIKDGPVLEALRATISIPVVFTPLKFAERFLVDGGIVNPLPVKIARQMGANYIIACNTVRVPKMKFQIKDKAAAGQAQAPAAEHPAAVKSGISEALNNKIDILTHEASGPMKTLQRFIEGFQRMNPPAPHEVDANTPSIFNALVQAIDCMENKIAQSQILEADIAITPDVGHIESLEFYRGKEAIEKGYEAAKAALSGLRL